VKPKIMQTNFTKRLNRPPSNPRTLRGSILVLILLSVFAFEGYAQNTVTGTVRDFDNEPLPGVSVIEKETTNGVITDIDGKISISVLSDATLVFSYIGFLSEETEVNNRPVVDIGLVPDLTELSELVVVGYGSMKQSDLTGAVASV